MKQPAVIRDYVLRVQEDALRRIRTRLSCSDPFERDASAALADNFMEGLAILTDTTMLLMGHEAPEVSDPRFDKTRRAANKLLGRRHGENESQAS